MAIFSDLMELVAVLDRDHAQQLITDVLGVISKHKADAASVLKSAPGQQ